MGKERYSEDMIRTTAISNGLRVVSQRVEHMHTVSIGIWVASGARHEQADVNGIAHFIEHLLFKGTQRRSAHQIAMEIDSMGGILNAFTGYEYVCFYAKVLASFLPRVLDLLTDIFLCSSFPDDEIERERKVILQEIKMRDDSPDVFIHDQFHQNFWQGHPLGRTIPGTVETVGAMSREQIVRYKQSRYHPRDIVISAAGNVRHEELVGLLEAAFSTFDTDWVSRTESPHPRTGVQVNLSDRDLEQTLVCMGTNGLSQMHSDRFAFYLLSTILGGGMSSRLFQEVREKRGLAYSIYSYVISHADCGALVVYAGTDRDQCRKVVDIALAEMIKLKTEPVRQDELDAAREQLKGNFLMSLESSDNLMMRLAKNEIYLGKIQTVDDVLACFDAVTVDDLQRLGAELFDGSRLNLEVMGKTAGLSFHDGTLRL